MLRRLFPVFIIVAIMAGAFRHTPAVRADTPVRRVNVPYFGGNVSFPQSAIFWFGQVRENSNYGDVRVGYNDNEIVVRISVFDKWLWYDETSPVPAELSDWDAVSLYLNLDGATGQVPSPKSHRFVGQLSHWQARPGYQTAYQGNGSGWSAASTPFTTKIVWRGSGMNSGTEARGWRVEFTIPFASLGLAGPPAARSGWGLSLALHDRDSFAGPPQPDQLWPEAVDFQRPATWGEMNFGMPTFTPPAATPGQVVTVRHKLNGATVSDAQVGGDTVCGSQFDPDYFNGWGDANYAGDDQINIQNQAEMADWPCFSKYYVTFPLDALPANKAILSATLTMYQFGNALPSQAPSSLIQVFTIAEDWNEATITWNNAPLAAENVAQSWVGPVFGAIDWPGWARTWDVSRAVAEAYTAGNPVRLALYEADWNFHSGKYFTSSDTGDWNAAGRPRLDILWGDVNDFSIDSVAPPLQTIDVGGTASYDLQIGVIGNFASAVDLQATTTSSNLVVDITPKQVNPPAQVSLTATHLGINSGEWPQDTGFTAGEWHDIVVSATAGSLVRTINFKLLTGGSQVFLPLLRK